MEELLERICRLGTTFSDTKSIEDLYETIVKKSLPVFDGFEGSIFIFSKGKLKRIYSTRGKVYDTIVDRRDIRIRIFNKTVPFILKGKDLEKERKIHPVLRRKKIKSIVLIPLFHLKKPIGLLSMWSKKEEPLIGRNPELIKLLGTISAVSLNRIKHRKKSSEGLEEILPKIYNSALKFLLPLNLEDTYKIIVNEAI